MSDLNYATAIYSVANGLNKYNDARNEEARLEALRPPTYQRNQSVLDFYQKALQKYETNPTDTAAYKLQKQNINQGITQGLAASNTRRLGGAAIPGIINNSNNALLKSAALGENLKSKEFNALGTATRLKSIEDQKAFQYNSLSPFDKNYNLLAAKAAANAQAGNASIQNTYNNLMAAESSSNRNGSNSKSVFGDLNLGDIFGKKKTKVLSTDYYGNTPINSDYA